MIQENFEMLRKPCQRCTADELRSGGYAQLVDILAAVDISVLYVFNWRLVCVLNNTLFYITRTISSDNLK